MVAAPDAIVASESVVPSKILDVLFRVPPVLVISAVKSVPSFTVFFNFPLGLQVFVSGSVYPKNAGAIANPSIRYAFDIRPSNVVSCTLPLSLLAPI